MEYGPQEAEHNLYFMICTLRERERVLSVSCGETMGEGVFAIFVNYV
jgi:hypothetical protein